MARQPNAGWLVGFVAEFGRRPTADDLITLRHLRPATEPDPEPQDQP